VKILTVFLISAGLAYGQAPGKIITFDKADTEHCNVVAVKGMPLLQSTYDGITVAIAMPMNRGNGDFSIFIAVSQTGVQPFQVNPKDFYGLFSDPDHTRFAFHDMAAETDVAGHPPGANGGMSAASAQAGPGSMGPGAMGPGGPPPGGGGTPDAGISGPPPPGSPNMSPAYFRKGKVKPGPGIAGWITLRKPSGGKLEVRPTDMLGEFDIPVNGILFRF
jgi:hypothetical protein